MKCFQDDSAHSIVETTVALAMLVAVALPTLLVFNRLGLTMLDRTSALDAVRAEIELGSTHIRSLRDDTGFASFETDSLNTYTVSVPNKDSSRTILSLSALPLIDPRGGPDE